MTTIRHATAAELAEIQGVLVESWHQTYDAIYGRERVAALTADWHSLEVLGSEAGRGVVRLVAEDSGGSLLATAAVSRAADGSAKLDQLYVRPAAQGKGLGAALIAAVLAEIEGVRMLVLEVEPANARAIAFYERVGFKRAGEVSDCGRAGSGIRALRYELALGPAGRPMG